MNSTKEISEQFEGTSQENKRVEANHTRKFIRKLGKILVAQVLWSTSSVSDQNSETGPMRFRRVRFQTSISVSFFLGLTELRGEDSVSSFQAIICVPKRTHRVFAELTEFAPKLSEAQ